MSDRDAIYSAALGRAVPFTLPGPWSNVPCHSGWCSIPWAITFAELRDEFSADELIDAGIAVQCDDALSPSGPILACDGPTFVVRSGPESSPYMLLPGGRSLDQMPAWRRFLSDYRAEALITNREPLVFASDPAELAVLMSLGLLAAPVPPVVEMDYRFLDGLVDALPGEGDRYDRQVIYLGWSVLNCTGQIPVGHRERLDQTYKLIRHLSPEIYFLTWELRESVLEQVQFLTFSGASSRLRDEVLRSLEHHAFDIENFCEPSAPRVSDDPVAAFLQATVAGVEKKELQLARLKYIEHFRKTTTLSPGKLAAGSTDAILLDAAAQALWAAKVALVEALAKTIVPQELNPGQRAPVTVAQAIGALERAVELVQRHNGPKIDVSQLFRRLG